MGKRLITQRRGRGTFTYKAHSHRFKGAVKYSHTNDIKGVIKDFIHCKGHSAPLAEVVYDGKKILAFAIEGTKVGEIIGVETKKASVLPLSAIPDGSFVHNIERRPGDGGKFVRSAGGSARILSHLDEEVIVRMPSKKQKRFNSKCRATIGIIAAGGKRDKPFLKAGKKMAAMRAKNKLYPKTSGVAMNAVDHPFGSGRGRHAGKPKTAPRFAPPGRNVGLIRAKKTGRGKRARKK